MSQKIKMPKLCQKLINSIEFLISLSIQRDNNPLSATLIQEYPREKCCHFTVKKQDLDTNLTKLCHKTGYFSRFNGIF